MLENENKVTVDNKLPTDIQKESRETRYKSGFVEGFSQAAEDYALNKLDFENFNSKDKGIVELTDYFGLGYEMGYLRKLSEIGMF